jgi:uncharacterized protein
MIEELKVLLRERNEAELKSRIQENPSILELSDESGTTLFLYLIYYGLSDTFEFAKTKKVSLSFHEAIVIGDMEFVKRMLSGNKNLLHQFSPDGFTPIALAAFFNQTAIAKYLLEKGANPATKASNPDKVNALHAAVAKDNFELCQLFLNTGMDINLTQNHDVTALHSAAKRGNEDIVRLLLEHKPDIYIKMDTGETAIELASKRRITELFQTEL